MERVVDMRFTVNTGVKYDGQDFSGFTGDVTNISNGYILVISDKESVEKMTTEYKKWCKSQNLPVNEMIFKEKDLV